MRGRGPLKSVKKPISYGRHWISAEDRKRVNQVLRSDWITQGPAVSEFEKRIASYCGSRFAVAVSSGTAALHLVCLAVGLKPGDEAITTPISFVATSNAVLYAGARPVFADIDIKTFNISPADISARVTPKTRTILPVHFGGLPADMEAISRIARAKNLKVIEDACHALGARYKIGGKTFQVGSCSHSDACVFSFHPVKAITTGEGGAVTTNDEKLYEKLLSLRSHGITRNPDLFQNKDLAFWKDEQGGLHPSPWYYEMTELGFNYRMCDMQAALGISQMDRLDLFVERRREIAAFYRRELSKIPGLKFQEETRSSKSAYHLFVAQIPNQMRGSIFDELKRNGINPQVHYIPIHRQPFYAGLGYKPGDFPFSEHYYECALSLPIYPLLKNEQIRHIVKVLKKILS